MVAKPQVAREPATLAFLHPTEPRELHYRGYKNSLRLHGSHFMTLRRASRLPESSRDYRSGDPVNLIDWKAYARTDQLLIREIRDEASALVRIAIDTTETMLWPDADVPQSHMSDGALPTKAEIACRVALNVAHQHMRMGDLVELWLMGPGTARSPSLLYKPRSPVDLVALYERLAERGFAADAFQTVFREAPIPQRKADAAFWVGDALGSGDFGAFFETARRGMLLHVLSSLEMDIAWTESLTSYFDEGQALAVRKEYQGQVLLSRGNYDSSLERWREKLAAEQQAAGRSYITLSDRTRVTPFQAALAQFLAARI